MMRDTEFEWTDEAQERDTARPRFYLGSKKNAEKSLAEGRPIFDDCERVEIHAGDKGAIPDVPVTDVHRKRWPRHYAQFKAGLEQTGSGQPLREWPVLTPAQVEELAYFKVKTVEELAALSDSNLQNIGPIRALRQKAIDAIAAGKKGAPPQKMRAELDELKNQNEVLKRQLAEQAADLKKLHEARK